MEEQGCPNNYVGVNIAKTTDGQYAVTHISLLDAGISYVGIGSKQKKPVPMSVQKLLHHHLDSPSHNPHHLTADQLWKT